MIGNCIGANNVPLAKRFFKLINYFVASMIFMLCSITFLAREAIAACFSNDEDVREMATTLIMLAALMHFFRGSQAYLQGPIRAMGLQKRASYFAIASYWLIAIPLSAIFAFKLNIGVIGLSIGLFFGVVFQACSYLSIVLRQDWQEIAD